MIVAFTLFIISLIGIALMLTAQIHKMNTGKAYIFFRKGPEFDRHLRGKMKEIKTTLSFFNQRTASLLFHFVLDKIEEKFIHWKDAGHKKAEELLEKAKAKESKFEAGKKASEFISKIKKPKEDVEN